MKMKKQLALLTALLILASGCSWINPLSDEGEQTADVFEPNRFLWEAAKSRLAFMGIVLEDKESGTIETGWSKVENGHEEFRAVAKVLSTELRSDCLQVKIYKRVMADGHWEALPESYELNQEAETAILNRARVLYRESLAIK